MNHPWKMGRLEIKNRLVRSATDEGFATPEGAPTQRLIDIDIELARGGVGLIIASTTHISLEGKWGNNGTGMDHDNLIKPLNDYVRQPMRPAAFLQHSYCIVVPP